MDSAKLISLEDAPQRIPFASTLCITGHRPEKLPKGEQLEALLHAMEYQLEQIAPLGFRYFLTGMADGIDYYAAHHLFEMRRSNPDIKVIGVSPCSDYRAFYVRHGYCVPHLDELEACIDGCIVLPGSSRSGGVFLKRDRYMVSLSSGILAVCSAGRSGSSYTLRQAMEEERAFCWLKPDPGTPDLPAPADWPVKRWGL